MVRSTVAFAVVAIDDDEALWLFTDVVPGSYKVVMLRIYTSNITQISANVINADLLASSVILQSSSILNIFGRSVGTNKMNFFRVSITS